MTKRRPEFMAKLGKTLTLLSIPALFFGLAGCTVSVAEKSSIRQDITYLLNVTKTMKDKVDDLERKADATSRDMENTRKGIASLDIEMKSATAESNAELDRFREEFNFVRGTIEETDFVREQLRDEIDKLREGQASTNVTLAEMRSVNAESGKNTKISDLETREGILKLTAKVQEIERLYQTLGKDFVSLEEQFARMEIPVAGSAAGSQAKPAIQRVGPETLFLRGQGEFTDSSYGKAIETMNLFLTTYPSHRRSAEAQFLLGESYNAKQDWAKAILEYNKVIKGYQDSRMVAPALLMQGLAFEKIDAIKEAKVILGRLAKKFPETEAGIAGAKHLKRIERGLSIEEYEENPATEAPEASEDETGEMPLDPSQETFPLSGDSDIAEPMEGKLPE